ncbi:outer membrane protein assembly factor BamB family protein [Pontiella sulfatireligans]|uniref:Outer membrane protein assembly factor BamB n=1 Tax=Pontiella sulfatireligans TaxID=2750658 RepID=A0A6C2UN94_9BACT|nr:PQQ-binding-like beta-propeller repeat protein [Pontiella sulfatireligans]VGO21750.1 Outer membrane protein assembly factor BamB [Pontiella sulfatireligans]
MNEFKQRPVLGLIAQSVALVAALLVLVVSVLLIADHVRLLQMDPLNDPTLLELRDQLANTTDGSEAVVEQIRTYDFYARRAFFGNQEQRRAGGALLLVGALVCFAALKLSKHWKPRLPTVGKPDTPSHWEMNNLFRQLMAGTAVFLVALSLFLAFAVQSDLAMVLEQSVEQAEMPAPHVAQASLPVPAEELKSNWPALRGPGGLGVAHFTSAPVSWDVESGDGVLWKSEIPVFGFNSPIVWGNRVFMSGADEEGQEVFCFDADTGEELWLKTIVSTVELPEVSEDTGHAAPTMATDGTRVFAIFASGELAALDLDGNLVWQKNLGVPENPYGMGSSLLSDGQRLFVQYDHEELQKVMAFDCATGKPAWQTARHHISWSTPALIETEAGPQLILNDEENVTAYDPATGKQLWTVTCLGGEVAPSPAFNGKDIVFVANEYAQASALKLNGGTPEILWQYDEYLPEISSPVAGSNLFFISTSAGDMICLDAATGDVKWEQEFDDGFSSSPVLVGDRIYSIDLGGIVYIMEATDEYKEIARIEMGEAVYATPAFMDNRIYIRGEEYLYCIGK